MSREHEPVRWAEREADCDPLLRRLIGSARAGVGDAALAQRVERAVRTQAAAASAGDEPTSNAALASRHWPAWVGVAVVVAGILAALVGSRSSSVSPSDTAAAGPAAVRGRGGERGPAASKGVGSAAQQSATARRTKPGPNPGPGTSADHAHADSLSANAHEAPPRVGNVEAATAGRRARAGSVTAERNPQRVSRRNTRRASLAAPSSKTLESDRSTERDVALDNRHAARQRVRIGRASVDRALVPDHGAVPPELSLISAAQRALRDAPQKALELVAQHERAYPHGRFAPEREEIAISALLALDQMAAARARARAFLSRFPTALSAPRVARLLRDSY